MATASSNLTGYDSSDYSYYSTSNMSNCYNSSNNTTYATITLTRGSGAYTYVYLLFSLPTIPSTATIDSIAVNYKARTSNTSTSNISTATIQLYSGTTAKGTAKSILSSSTAV